MKYIFLAGVYANYELGFCFCQYKCVLALSNLILIMEYLALLASRTPVPYCVLKKTWIMYLRNTWWRWKYILAIYFVCFQTAPEAASNDKLLYALVQELVEFSDTIHAAGNCYGSFMNKDYDLYCPFATRTPNGTIMVKDLSREYFYLGNNSAWFTETRERGRKITMERANVASGKLFLDIPKYSMILHFWMIRRSFDVRPFAVIPLGDMFLFVGLRFAKTFSQTD